MRREPALDHLIVFLGLQGFRVEGQEIEPASRPGEPGRRVKVIGLVTDLRRTALAGVPRQSGGNPAPPRRSSALTVRPAAFTLLRFPEHARTKRRDKRGGGAEQVPLDDVAVAIEPPSIDVLQLDDALRHLATVNRRQSDIVEMRYFGGMTHDEMAEAIGLSATTVDRELRLAKAWLRRDLSVAL